MTACSTKRVYFILLFLLSITVAQATEIKSIGVIDPALKSINDAIRQKDLQAFKKGFIELTTNCNNCHKSNQHGFNAIVIPTASPVVNQDFKPAK